MEKEFKMRQKISQLSEKEKDRMNREYLKEIDDNLKKICDIKVKMYDKVDDMEALDILKMEFLDNYEGTLIGAKNRIEDGFRYGVSNEEIIRKNILEYIELEFDDKRLTKEYLEIDIEVLENNIQAEKAIYENRLERYNRELEINAPYMIVDDERRLLKESLTIIELLEYYLEQNKYWLLTPEERLLKSIFGE